MPKENVNYEIIRERVRKIISDISSYPVALSWADKESLKKELVEIYKKNDDVIKGYIIAIINERLSSFRYFRDFLSMSLAKERGQNIKAEDITTAVLDYTSSFDGIDDFLSLLLNFDDTLSLKLLSFHLTRYLNLNTQESRLLSLRAIKGLGQSKNSYAAQLLIVLSDITKDELLAAVLDSLKQWEEKLDKIKIDKKEKEKIKEEISKIFIHFPSEQPKVYG
ncbi:MAG: hypothetical protein QXI89_00480 [Candidatus Anstonellales archaeon]